MSYGRYNTYNYPDRAGSTLISRKYTGSSGYGGSTLLPNKYSGNYGNTANSRSTYERQPAYDSYSSTIHDAYDYSTTSRNGRTKTRTNDLVRPSTRSRQLAQSMTRETSTRKSTTYRDSSVPRTRKNSNTEYPEFPQSPARAPRPLPLRPEFKTIMSSYNKKSQKSYSTSNGYTDGHSSINGYSRTNGFADSRNGYPYKIEVERSIHKPATQRMLSVDEPPAQSNTYSPTFAQNRTSNNNNKEYESGSGSSTRSSTSTARRGSESMLNGDPVTSTSSGRDLGYGYSSKHSLTSTSSGRDVAEPNAGLVGLKNIGNTCFMNSIIQCLSNTKPLRDYCLEKRYLGEINRKSSSSAKEKLVEAFSDVIRQIWHPSPGSGPISTATFKSKIQKFSNRFSGYEQQDSQEFLRFLIEGLHEDVNKVTRKHKDSIPNFDSLCDESKAKKTWDFYLGKDDSYIVDLFMGQLRSSLECAECGHISTTFDPFWDLSLPIPKGSSSYSSYSDKITLQRCLDNFTKEEILDRDERPTCDRCKGRRRMTKKFTIYRFPRILVIHLKRFNEGQRYRQKLSNEVEFPHKLEISIPVSTSPATYNLYAVSNHSGSCYGGHYTAYCKSIQSGKWYSFSDSLVSAMSSSSVQSKEAYVLFYELTSSSRSHL